MVAEGGEGENPLPFSLTAPKRRAGWGGGGGGGRGGIPASFPSRSPPPKQPFQPTPTPSPGSHQEVCDKIAIGEVWVVFVGEKAPGPWRAGPQALGARAPSPLETWPTGPGWIPPLSLTSCKPRCYHNPQSADLGGVGWFPKAELYSSMRGGVPVFAPAFQPLGRAPAPGDLANKPLSPASWSRIPKMPRCSSAHEKPGLLHRLISCARSLQPSLTFLLRRNNKVQGARS